MDSTNNYYAYNIIKKLYYPLDANLNTLTANTTTNIETTTSIVTPSFAMK